MAAERAGISLSHFSDIERGRRNPSPPVLASIAEALGVPTTGLMPVRPARKSA